MYGENNNWNFFNLSEKIYNFCFMFSVFALAVLFLLTHVEKQPHIHKFVFARRCDIYIGLDLAS